MTLTGLFAILLSVTAKQNLTKVTQGKTKLDSTVKDLTRVRPRRISCPVPTAPEADHTGTSIFSST